MKNKFGVVRVRYIHEEERHEYSLMPDTYRDMNSAERNAAYLGDEIGDMLIPFDVAYVSDVSKKPANIWITISKNESKMVKSLFSISTASMMDIDFMSWIDFWENGEADDMLEVAYAAGVDRPTLAKAAYYTVADYLSFDGVDSSVIKAVISAISGKNNSCDIATMKSLHGELLWTLDRLKGGQIADVPNSTSRSIGVIKQILVSVCYSDFILHYAIVDAGHLVGGGIYTDATKARTMLGRKLSAILPLREVLLASVK